MTDQMKKGWLIPILTSIITSLSVVAGAWFSFQGNVEGASETANASRLETAFKRIEYLETKMRQQQAASNSKIIELTTQVFRLQGQLDKELNIEDMFIKFMDGLPFEAWLKTVDAEGDDLVFRGHTVNTAYEYKHGISKNRYKGSTDRSLWGKKIAEEFRKNDLVAYNSKGSIITYEHYPEKPSDRYDEKKYRKRLVMKMYIELVEGQPMVFGMTLEVDDSDIIQAE